MKQVRNILTRVRGYTEFDPHVVALGYEVTILNHPFWVHRTIRGEGMRPLAKHLVYWTVTEPETGMAVYMSNAPETRREAIERASRTVSDTGLERLAVCIARSKEQLDYNGIYHTNFGD